MGAKIEAPVFMALAVATLTPEDKFDVAVNSTTEGVYVDWTHIATVNPVNLSGPSQAFTKACIGGHGMDVSAQYLPNMIGNWTFSYVIQYYFPNEAGNYTHEDNKVCLAQPMNGAH